jgi:hypothetical protein
MECIDLQDLFGEKHRIRNEQGGKQYQYSDPWEAIIPGLHGDIYPHGGNLLGVATKKRGGIATRLADLPFTTVTQDGDDGMNLTFELEDFDTVAEIVRLRRRRQLSDEQRAAAAEHLKQFQFQAASDAPNSTRKTQATQYDD